MEKKYCLHAIESLIRANSWEATLETFFRTNSPRFKNFRETFECGEVDLQMTVVHNEFLRLVETNISTLIRSIGIQDDVLAMSLEECKHDEIVDRLVAATKSYTDFVEFGKLMEEQYAKFYSEPLASTRAHVRVLWDIENILPQRGLQTVEKINGFLQSIKALGPGIDTRVTAFFNQKTSVISDEIIQELDKAAVELVWVSRKREDADRKIGIRINQEMLVLKPSITTFILISSDQDFRHHMQLLKNAGFQIIIIHQATSANWRRTLEMNASAAYLWTDIIGTSKPCSGTKESSTTQSAPRGGNGGRGGRGGVTHPEVPAGDNIDTEEVALREGDNPTGIEEKGAYGDKQQPTSPSFSKKNKFQRRFVPSDRAPTEELRSAAGGEGGAALTSSPAPHPPSSSSSSSSRPRPGGSGVRDVSKGGIGPVPLVPFAPSGWRVGVCTKWKGAFGFFAVHPMDPEVTIPETSSSSTSLVGAVNELASLHITHQFSQSGPGTPDSAPTQAPAGACVSVYVHHSLVEEQPRRGSVLLLRVESGEKGLRAAATRNAFPGVVLPLALGTASSSSSSSSSTGGAPVAGTGSEIGHVIFPSAVQEVQAGTVGPPSSSSTAMPTYAQQVIGTPLATPTTPTSIPTPISTSVVAPQPPSRDTPKGGSVEAAVPARGRKICVFFHTVEGCLKGDGCDFSHVSPAQGSSEWKSLRDGVRRVVASQGRRPVPELLMES